MVDYFFRWMDMKSEPRFVPARPNIFPSHIGLEPRKPTLRDWTFLIFLLLPALTLYEGAALIRQAWSAVRRPLGTRKC